jgi:2-iminobutanoate/2-iminopropanoate deaminase
MSDFPETVTKQLTRSLRCQVSRTATGALLALVAIVAAADRSSATTDPARIERVVSPDVTEPAPGTWSNSLKLGDTVYISGMTARDKNLKAVGGGEYEQARLIFQRIEALLRAAGGSMRDVVKLNLYVTRIAKRAEVWRARREFFDGAFPVATLVEVSALAEPGILVEIEAVAVLNRGGRPSQ